MAVAPLQSATASGTSRGLSLQGVGARSRRGSASHTSGGLEPTLSVSGNGRSGPPAAVSQGWSSGGGGGGNRGLLSPGAAGEGLEASSLSRSRLEDTTQVRCALTVGLALRRAGLLSPYDWEHLPRVPVCALYAPRGKAAQ